VAADEVKGFGELEVGEQLADEGQDHSGLSLQANKRAEAWKRLLCARSWSVGFAEPGELMAWNAGSMRVVFYRGCGCNELVLSRKIS
jgi:hypothetical protein